MVRRIWHFVRYCSDVFDYSDRMLPILACLWSHELWLCRSLEAQECSLISTGREDIVGGSAVLPKLGEGLEFELSHF